MSASRVSSPSCMLRMTFWVSRLRWFAGSSVSTSVATPTRTSRARPCAKAGGTAAAAAAPMPDMSAVRRVIMSVLSPCWPVSAVLLAPRARACAASVRLCHRFASVVPSARRGAARPSVAAMREPTRRPPWRQRGAGARCVKATHGHGARRAAGCPHASRCVALLPPALPAAALAPPAAPEIRPSLDGEPGLPPLLAGEPAWIRLASARARPPPGMPRPARRRRGTRR
jgi:hypothetical protein